MKKQPVMQGGASILIVLIMLSLSMFGVVSLVSAYADYRLAQKNAAFIQLYYDMDGEAEELVEQIKPLIQRNAGEEEYAQAGWTPVWIYRLLLMRDIVMEDQKLSISLELDGQGGYRVASWKLAIKEFPQGEATQNLWDGQLPPEK